MKKKSCLFYRTQRGIRRNLYGVVCGLAVEEHLLEYDVDELIVGH